MQFAVRNVSKAAKYFGFHTHCIKRHHLLCLQEKVITSNAGSFLHAVDDGDAPLEVAAVGDRGINRYTMFDHHGWCAAIVPHEPVVVSDMYKQYIWIIDKVTSIDRAGFRRVMFQVNFRQTALFWTQYLELILEVVLRRLIDDEI